MAFSLEVKRDPEYYIVKPQNSGSEEKESCLATGFTVQNITDTIWPPGVKEGAVRFTGEAYYSRLILNDTTDCNEIDNCGTKAPEVDNFKSDAKTNFFALSIFWIRCFLNLVIQSQIGSPG
ncbi:hypothetical protein PHYPO_G00199780 [Pangasianodon hypophthalmus]|uniref:Uncharacterized protein n=1 Tax=Pangasianodon hypophthalmus TaxID=310915 RepID=A0A5N5PJK7_PANHP|nr:hypothetical protein PHYPO_G00199780 [Pangasianodon hypophthalmus]